MKTSRRALDLYKALDIRKTSDLYKTSNIRKTLLPLDGCNGTHRVNKVREDKASRPVLDVEEVTVLLSTSAKA